MNRRQFISAALACAIITETHLSGVSVAKNGPLQLNSTHKEYGAQTWRTDEDMLKPLEMIKLPGPTATDIDDLESDTPGMTERQANDFGAGDNPDIKYVLRWETLGPNRDQPREGPPPPPTTLRVVALRK